MTAPRRISPDEYVVTAWAETAAGPGWSNSLVLALVCKRGTTDYRIEYLQPDEQTKEMCVLFSTVAAATAAMTRAAKLALDEVSR